MENTHHQAALNRHSRMHAPKSQQAPFLAYALGHAGGISWPQAEQQEIVPSMDRVHACYMPVGTHGSGAHELD